jgi:hypothetical protein
MIQSGLDQYDGPEHPKFVSYQTHMLIDTDVERIFENKIITIIHATDENGFLYEKRIAINTRANWIRIDDLLGMSDE